MPNKDSFTFSDKLRKSKSVPLSKRLPSIVGGKNTQKRTLVQRAQRDLPFILVAALALLLLPFLSRTGSDDIASTGDLAWNTLTDAPSFSEGVGAEIMTPSSMEDPMKWIISPRSAVESSDITAGESTRSAYGSEDDDGSASGYSRSGSYSKSSKTSTKRPDYNTRSSYDEKYITKKTKTPATTKYGEKTRAAVRKSFVRKGTDINRALRISPMPGAKGGSGVSHALPIGQGPTRTPNNSIREGVRPVALQRMESQGGVGRGMEGLRAEADRSIREMNAGGPAKANLLAAQMKDVDGKPTQQGPGFGGPNAGGASVRPGGPGGPSNTNGYSVQKPWWWDMMQTRSQKMWDLLYYKPREIFWNNIYNYMSQLMNCLATGNRDGDVSTMFGKKAGDDQTICIGNPNWSTTLEDFLASNAGSSTQKNSDGKSETTTTETSAAMAFWKEQCLSYKGAKIGTTQGQRKSAWKVRMECVGIDFGRFKNWRGKEYNTNCDGVSPDGIAYYTVDARKKALFRKEYRDSDYLNNRVVIALVARPKVGGEKYDFKDYDGHEYVVYAENGQALSNAGIEFANQFNANFGNCELTQVISFVSNRIFKVNVKSEVEKLNSTKDYALIDFSDRAAFSQQYCAGDKSAKSRSLTLDELKDDLDPKKNSYNYCRIPSPGKYVKEMKLNDIECYNYPSVAISIDERSTAEAIIPKAGNRYVFAVAVEQLTSMKDSVIRGVKEYGLISDANADKLHKGYEIYGNDSYRFFYETNLGVEGTNLKYGDAQNPETLASSDTVRGDGKIFWLVTSSPKLADDVKTGSDKFKGVALEDITAADFIADYENSGICHYRWCNDVAGCSLDKANRGKVCKHSNGKYYSYEIYNLVDEPILFPIQERTNYKPTGSEPDCTELCRDEEYINCPHSKKITIEEAQKILEAGLIDLIPPCNPYCQYKGIAYDATLIDGKYYITNATPRAVNINGLPKCSPLAWAWENGDFRIYDFVDEYDDEELPLIPNQLMDATSATHQSYTTRLRYLEQSDLFIIIRGQAIASSEGDVNFKLFPRLVLPSDIDVDLSPCAFCGESLYDNADVRASDETMQRISTNIRQCLTKIKELESLGATESVKELKTIYFYGYASKRGSHDAYELPGKGGKGSYNVGCTTSQANKGFDENDDPRWGDCNRSLSEDRNLYIMDQLVNRLSEFDIGVDEASTKKYQGLKGFSNTLPKNPAVINKTTKRLIKHPSADGEEFTFVSRPYGSDGADKVWNDTIENQKRDRLVLIAPVGGEREWDGPRMTCEEANKRLNTIKENIKSELRSKNLAVSKNRSKGEPMIFDFASVTTNDENSITAEDIAQLLKNDNQDDTQQA